MMKSPWRGGRMREWDGERLSNFTLLPLKWNLLFSRWHGKTDSGFFFFSQSIVSFYPYCGKQLTCFVCFLEISSDFMDSSWTSWNNKNLRDVWIKIIVNTLINNFLDLFSHNLWFCYDFMYRKEWIYKKDSLKNRQVFN